MELLDLLELSHRRALGVVEQVAPDDLSRPTPCDEWNVLMLLNKMQTSSQLFAELAAGRQPEKTLSLTAPAADLPPEPTKIIGLMEASIDQCLAAFNVGRARGQMVGPLGATLSRRAGAMIRVTDCTVNTWDLAKAIGAETNIDDDHARAVLSFADDYLAEARDMDGEPLFADPLEIRDDLPPLSRLIALSGRDPAWSPAE